MLFHLKGRFFAKESPCYLLSHVIRSVSTLPPSFGVAISFQNSTALRPSGVSIRSATTQSTMVSYILSLFGEHCWSESSQDLLTVEKMTHTRQDALSTTCSMGRRPAQGVLSVSSCKHKHQLWKCHRIDLADISPGLQQFPVSCRVYLQMVNLTISPSMGLLTSYQLYDWDN